MAALLRLSGNKPVDAGFDTKVVVEDEEVRVMPVGAYLSFLLLALSSAAVSQQSYKPLPKSVIHAKYVLVTTYQGYDLSNPNVMPDDRAAAVAVQDAIRKWGRYSFCWFEKDVSSLPNLNCESARVPIPHFR